MNRENIIGLEEVLYDSNKTLMNYNKEITIHELFQRQVEKHPDKIAVLYRNESITFRELNEKGNQLARRLRASGVKKNSVVGLIVSRSIEMFIGLIGILKSGGCYLPIDPSIPNERVNYMIENSDAIVILTQKQLETEINFSGRKFFLDDKSIYNGSNTNLEEINTAEDLAYVIYTSGTTGKPKGVMVEHRMVHNFILGVTQEIDFASNKSMICLTTLSFDIFLLESLLPLTKGMKVIIADPMKMWQYIKEEKVDMLQTTPSTIKLILNDKNNIKYIENLTEVMVGGEQFPDNLLAQLKKITKAKIYNMYGPTETTVWSTIKELTHSDKINVGKPIANTEIYILDERGAPLSIGNVGELCISGDGVTRGYINNEGLTKEKYIESPYIPGKRLYKTGDLAKWLLNGEIQLLGRTDFQVKIRGFRIELGEIESNLEKYDKIRECVVWTSTNAAGDKSLVVYYVADEDINVTDLIRFLKDSLPEYMIPGFYIKIDKIPLTDNGKIDRKSLPSPDTDRPNLCNEYIPPITEVEKKVVEIWQKVLNRSIVGINDNFFELGGNSVLVSQLYIELEKCFPNKIDIVDIFAYPSVSKLCEFIKSKNKHTNLKTIHTMKLPTMFYRSTKDTAKVVLTTNLDEGIGLKFHEYTERNNFEVSNFLLGLYIHLLSEVTGENNLGVYLAMDDSNSYQLISVDFNKISQLDDLISEVNNRISSHDPINHYHLNEFNNLIVEDVREIIPTFYCNQERKENDIKEIEIALIYKNDFNRHTLKMIYNDGILNQKEIEGLFSNYIKVLKTIIEGLL